MPYVGLRPFRRDDHELFFGRDHCVNELLYLLEKTTFFVVIGEAYSGKSSLMSAGLEAKLLQNNENNGVIKWHIANFRPYSAPFLQLSNSLLKPDALGDSFLKRFKSVSSARRFLRQNLIQSSQSLHTLLAQKPLPKGHKLLLICDQFEDIFHLWQQDKEKAQEFIDFLIDSSQQHPLKPTATNHIHVIITLRSAYLNQVALFPKLEDLIKNNLFLTPHLTKQQLKIVMIEPIRVIKFKHQETTKKETLVKKKISNQQLETNTYNAQAEINRIHQQSVLESETMRVQAKKLKDKNNKNLTDSYTTDFSPELAEHLLEIMDGSQEQLPLLQHLLTRIWSLSVVIEKHHLTLDAYKKPRLGSFNNALPQHLDETYYYLNDNQPQIAEILFRRLTAITDDNNPQLLQHPVKLEDIATLAETSINEVINVINVFRTPGREFLKPAHPEELKVDTLIEISHDVIVSHWQRLKNWIEKEKLVQKNYQQLNTLAHEYDRNGSKLLKSSQLDNLWLWSKQGKFNKIWAEYYGCDFEKSHSYLLKSKRYSTAVKYIATFIFISVIIGTVIGLVKIDEQQQYKKEVLEILYLMKEELVTEKNSLELEVLFKKITEESHNNPSGWLYYGLSLSYQKKWDAAERALNKGYELAPNNNQIVLALAKTLMQKQQHGKALWLLNTANEEPPSNAAILELIADILVLENVKTKQKIQLKTAVANYQQALVILPKNDDILRKLAQALSSLGKYQESINTLNNVVSINPNQIENWKILGLELMKNSQFNEAIKAFSKALGLAPNDDKNWRNLGLALYKNKNFLEAKELFAKAVILNENSDENYRNLGDVFMRLKQFKNALISYNNAQKLNPTSKINLIKKAKSLTKLNRINEANRFYEQASTIKERDWE